MLRVKICGITNLEDARAAVEAGADALGFVFASSPRRVDPAQVSEIVDGLPPFVSKVGVFVDAGFEEITRTMTMCHLNAAQLHGEESPELCARLFPGVIKSFRVKGREVLERLPLYTAGAYLLDGFSPRAAGGAGAAFDWEIAREAKRLGNIILSGGLTPENVHRAVLEAQPYAVDVSSGVEARPGKKDHGKLRDFIRAARESAGGGAG